MWVQDETDKEQRSFFASSSDPRRVRDIVMVQAANEPDPENALYGGTKTLRKSAGRKAVFKSFSLHFLDRTLDLEFETVALFNEVYEGIKLLVTHQKMAVAQVRGDVDLFSFFFSKEIYRAVVFCRLFRRSTPFSMESKIKRIKWPGSPQRMSRRAYTFTIYTRAKRHGYRHLEPHVLNWNTGKRRMWTAKPERKKRKATPQQTRCLVFLNLAIAALKYRQVYDQQHSQCVLNESQNSRNVEGPYPYYFFALFVSRKDTSS